MTTTTTNKPSNEQRVIAALDTAQEATVDEVAAAAGIGRTSARKYLVALEQTGKASRVPGGREGKRKLPDRYSPVAAKSGASPARAEGARKGTAQRLRPGGLDELVLGYMRQHSQEGPFGPTTVAKGLGRSSGAVGNCLARLGAAGKLSQVSQRPRRYALQEA